MSNESKKIFEIIYINLCKNLFRRIYIITLLYWRRIPFRRIPGVRYSASCSRYQYYTRQGFFDYLFSPENSHRFNGVVGCWIAHVSAIESISCDYGITMIIEDDFYFDGHFIAMAERMIENFDRDFDILLFDPWGAGPLVDHQIGDGIYKIHGSPIGLYGGTHCVFINNIKRERILDEIRRSKIRDYDSFILENSSLDIFIFYTYRSSVINFRSNITQ